MQCQMSAVQLWQSTEQRSGQGSVLPGRLRLTELHCLRATGPGKKRPPTTLHLASRSHTS